MKASRVNKQSRSRLFYALSAVIFIFLVTIFPFIFSLYLSFTNFRFIGVHVDFVGLKNYITVLSNLQTWNSFKVAAIFTLGGVFFEIILGISLGYLMNRSFFGKKFMRSVLIIPMVIPPVVVGLIWRFFFNADYGLINHYLARIGLPRLDWLGSAQLALPTIIAVDVWQWVPFIALTVLASLENIPSEPLEAASIDGASKFQIMKYVSLPLIKPVVTAVGLIRLVDSLKSFELIFIMTEGGPGSATQIINYFIYLISFRFYRLSEASALAILFTIIIGFISTFFVKVQLKQEG